MIPFAEWRPDMPALGQWAREALNVVPAEESYRPLNELSGVSSALASRGKTLSAANRCQAPSAAGSRHIARRWRGTGTC